MRVKIVILAFFLSILAFNCEARASKAMSPKERGVLSISTDRIVAEMQFFSCDAFQGRSVGSLYGAITAEYIAMQFGLLGLKPLTANITATTPIVGDSLALSRFFQPFKAKRIKEGERRFTIDIQKSEEAKAVTIKNVVAVLEGAKTDEFVVVGAHYDHLGVYSTTDKPLEGYFHGDVFNGADDNASGIIGILEIARAFKASGVKPDKTIIFVLFDGEEVGLLGSKYFAKAMGENISKIKLMLNFDMIGRNDGNVTFMYSPSPLNIDSIAKDNIVEYGIILGVDYRCWPKGDKAGSDIYPFVEADIPFMWYHTGGHSDYHKPSDTWDKINYPKMTNIIRSAYLNVFDLSNVITQ